MDSRSSSTLEAFLKIRCNKKWKKRHCVLRRPSSGSEHAELIIHKNVHCGLATTRKTEILHLEGFYGLESRFSLGKENHTLAILCHTRVIVAAFETDFVLRTWELWLGDFFGQGFECSVQAVDVPLSFSKWKNACLRLHLLDRRLCLVYGRPPSILVKLEFRALRRFGPTPARQFAIEVGSQAGPYAGVYTFRVDSIDHLAWMFQLACSNRLNNFLSNRDEENGVALLTGSHCPSTRTNYGFGGGFFDSKGKNDCQCCACAHDRNGSRNEAQLTDKDTQRSSNAFDGMERDNDTVRHLNSRCGQRLDESHRDCERTCSKASPVAGAISSACCRCRNYVNQPFIESLQYYYNIDHVVLALSRKSKCCDHVCTAERHDDQANTERKKKMLDASAKISAHKRGESTFVPSKNYAAMAPKGGLYVLMEPGSVSPGTSTRVERRQSQTSVPPDDPSHVDESKVVVVPKEGNGTFLAKTGIIVKPFEPLVLTRSSIRSRRRRALDEQRNRSKATSRSPYRPTFEEMLKQRRQSDQYSRYSPAGEPLQKRYQPSPGVDPGSVGRSASFSARDALRSSTRRTRKFLDTFARRASSVIFGPVESEHHDYEDIDDGRLSRSQSEPPSSLDACGQGKSVSIYPRKVGEWRGSVDLDEVIYEGVPLRSLERRNVGLKSIGRNYGPRTEAGRCLVLPQRSVGAESTLSSDSCASRVVRSELTMDSGSLLSEASDLDTVFRNDDPQFENKFGGKMRSCVRRRRSNIGALTTHHSRRLELMNSTSGYDGDGSSDSYAFASASIASGAPTIDQANVVVQSLNVGHQIEQRMASYSPPPPLDRDFSEAVASPESISISRRSSKVYGSGFPPTPAVEGEIFKFPPYVMDDCDESTFLNYATLAMQDMPSLTPTSAGRCSLSVSTKSPTPSLTEKVNYLKIDAVATKAARNAITSRRDDFAQWLSSPATLSDGDQSVDAMSRSVISERSLEKGRRPFSLKKRQLLRRRLSFASLSGV